MTNKTPIRLVGVVAVTTFILLGFILFVTGCVSQAPVNKPPDITVTDWTSVGNSKKVAIVVVDGCTYVMLDGDGSGSSSICHAGNCPNHKDDRNGSSR